MTNFKVTILIPHHNYQEYLPQAIQSAKNQTYPCNICVIDDKSDDLESVKKIVSKELFGNNPKSYQYDKEKNIETIYNESYTSIYLKNGPNGPSYARNRGIEFTWNHTDIYLNLDADDEAYLNKVEECVKIFAQSTEIGVVYADHDTLNITTESCKREYREPFNMNRLQQECIVHSGALFTKKALEIVKEDTGFYDENMRTCEDFDLWSRIAEKFMIVHIPKSLTLVRIQPKNSTDTVAKEIWENNWKRIHYKRLARNKNDNSTNTTI